MNKQKVCPACQGSEIKEIVYGMPDIESFDFKKYAVGGCCVSDNDPSYLCKTCKVEF